MGCCNRIPCIIMRKSRKVMKFQKGKTKKESKNQNKQCKKPSTSAYKLTARDTN